MPNRLGDALSPYLLQHAANPVEWQVWDEEALQAARDAQKPIFLSIGYSSCHWCHVMAHESFEDPEIARLLAEDFISIKVDREQRPDIDHIYMEAVQAMTGHGGWPLSVFLTPDLAPFFGGTYWPRRARGGMPGFDQVLRAVANAWRQRRDEVATQADRIVQFLRENQVPRPDGEPAALDDAPLRTAEDTLRQMFDARHGGFGGAPKFPQPLAILLLLRRWRGSGDAALAEIISTTLDRMAAGGIYDHLGGGFHRYSVDERWLVPHFEKMLYDNALLAHCYAEAFALTANAEYARVARETLDYLLRDMRHPGGGLFSSEDADSEGHEGKFYVWTPDEVAAVLGPRAATFCQVYDVTETGNFEGRNILNLSRPLEVEARMRKRDIEPLRQELDEDRRLLLAARANRVRPGRDDKIIVSWNALAIAAFARAGQVLGEPRYVAAAAAAANFLLAELGQGAVAGRAADLPSPVGGEERVRGGLAHCWRDGRMGGPAFLDDYAGLADSLLTLAEATSDAAWQQKAAALASEMVERFADPEGGFYYTDARHEPLLLRVRDGIEGAVPSGNSLAATALVRLGRFSRDEQWTRLAERSLLAHYGLMRQIPTAMGQMLLALDEYLMP